MGSIYEIKKDLDCGIGFGGYYGAIYRVQYSQ